MRWPFLPGWKCDCDLSFRQ